MDFIRIYNKKNKYWKAIWNIYEESFPIFEQRTIGNQEEVLKDDRYNCVAVLDKDFVVGIIFYWKWDNYKYIEHLAIEKSLRGRNYGSKILEKIYDDGEFVILEIDPPVDKISLKRLKFYENKSFRLQEFNHVHPPYRKEFKGHKLKVMSYNKNLSLNEYNNFNDFLRNTVMKYSQDKNK